MHIETFRPKEAVQILSEEFENPEISAAMRVWALSGLIAWVALDQKGRTRRKAPGKDKLPIRTRHAKRARLHTLFLLLSQRQQLGTATDELGSLIARLTVKASGSDLATIVQGPSASDLLDDFRDAASDLRYVAAIVRFVIQSCLSDGPWRPSIELAKAYVEKYPPEGCRPYGDRNISEIWQEHRLVAPYIFALHEESSFEPEKAQDVKCALAWLMWFADQPQRLQVLLGRAAYALDVMKNFAEDQRLSDFDGIEREVPEVGFFTENERQRILSLDRKGGIVGRRPPTKKPISRV